MKYRTLNEIHGWEIKDRDNEMEGVEYAEHISRRRAEIEQCEHTYTTRQWNEHNFNAEMRIKTETKCEKCGYVLNRNDRPETDEEYRTRKEKEEEAKKTQIRQGLQAMLARGITWEMVEKSMGKEKVFCPRELTVNGKAIVKLTIVEAKKIVSLI